MHTKLFLDGGIPDETRRVIGTLGRLDGQTTNPSLIVKHPDFLAYAQTGGTCSKERAWSIYRSIVSELSALLPDGSVSIEVYADANTTADEMVASGRELNRWVPNAHIKLPILREGLRAAHTLAGEGVRLNMTLCFSQEQAAAVYAATKGARKGDVFVSPFVGRLDDTGENGMHLIANILKMYQAGDGHVEVLAASIRSVEHLSAAIALHADIATAPASVLEAFADLDSRVSDETYRHEVTNLRDIPYRTIDLDRPFEEYDIEHELTRAGVERFVADWRKVVSE